MKRICFFLLACFVISMLAAQDIKELYILHTNDMHSRIEPFASYFPDTLLAGKAGVVRRAALIKQERKKHADLLLFDCGDCLKVRLKSN